MLGLFLSHTLDSLSLGPGLSAELEANLSFRFLTLLVIGLKLLFGVVNVRLIVIFLLVRDVTLVLIS